MPSMGKKFGSDSQGIEEATASTKFKLVQEGIADLFSRWHKAFEVDGGYVEKFVYNTFI